MLQSLNDISKIVSRETIQNLKEYEDILKEVNKTINLVSRKDVCNLWDRHIMDSFLGYVALCYGEGEEKVFSTRRFLDIGSGGGFPGIPISIILPKVKGILCESIKKKCIALTYFKKSLSLNVEIIPTRIEEVDLEKVGLVVSRGVSRLNKLLEYTSNKLIKTGTALFWKGLNFQKEIDEARKKWNFDVDVISIRDILQEVDDKDHRVWLLIKNIKHR